EVIEYRRLRTQRAARRQREIKRDKRRDSHRSTRHDADKPLIAHTTSDEPIDRRPRQRCEDDQTEKVIFHSLLRVSRLTTYSFKILASSTSNDSRLKKI